MQINTGEITRLELELGETMQVLFRSRTGDTKATLGIVIGTRELPNGDTGLTVLIPSKRLARPDATPPTESYVEHLIA